MSPYTTGAIAMRELAATAADEQGQHGVAASIRLLAIPEAPTDPAPGTRFVWDDEPGFVAWAHGDTVSLRLDSGAMRWPSRRQWDDAVRDGAIRVLP